MGTLSILKIVLLFCAAEQISGQWWKKDDCCYDLRCWEKCFEEPKDPVWRNAFNQIYKMVNGIRGLYSPCSRPKGTCFSLDSTVHSAAGVTGADMMEFERNLAAIIALTQPVSNENNPFFLNKFYQTFAWAADSDWQCKENCAAAQVLLSNPVDQHQTELIPQTSGLRYYGCYLCRYQFDGRFRSGKCHVNTDKNKELMVAFVNSQFDDTPPASWPCDTMNRVIIGTDPASSLTDMHNWAVTPAPSSGQFWSSGLAYQIPFNRVNLIATQKLLRCIRNKCCANEPPAKKRSASDQDTFYYLTKESVSECGGESNDCQPELKKFSGRSDDFIEKVVIPKTQNNDPDLVTDPCDHIQCKPPKKCFKGRCVYLETDCNACISEFYEGGGCTCLENPSCDLTGLIPEGCYQCGDKAMEFCRSVEEKQPIKGR